MDNKVLTGVLVTVTGAGIYKEQVTILQFVLSDSAIILLKDGVLKSVHISALKEVKYEETEL